MKKRNFEKHVWIPCAFLIYSAIVYAYCLPRSTASARTWAVTMGVNVLILVALAWLLRKKQRLADEREKDMKDERDEDGNGGLSNKKNTI